MCNIKYFIQYTKMCIPHVYQNKHIFFYFLGDFIQVYIYYTIEVLVMLRVNMQDVKHILKIEFTLEFL